ncbi:MAG: RidA family protein [Bryobacteraceae bacterium]
MPDRQNISSGGKWEGLIGYSRVVRVGTRLYVSGSTAADEHGQIMGPNDAFKQTAEAILNIERGLRQAGATLENIVRTRMFVTDISRWKEYGRAHGEFFGQIRPCATMVEVRALIHPDMLIEIEADAEL